MKQRSEHNMKLTPLAIGLICYLTSALAFSADPINISSSGSVIGDDVLYNLSLIHI